MTFDPGFVVKDISEARHGEFARGNFRGPASFIFFQSDDELLAIVFGNAGDGGIVGPIVADPPRSGICQTFGTDWHLELDAGTVSYTVDRYHRTLGSVLTSKAGSILVAGASSQTRHAGHYQLDLKTLTLVDEPRADRCIAHSGWSIWRRRDDLGEPHRRPLLSWPLPR